MLAEGDGGPVSGLPPSELGPTKALAAAVPPGCVPPLGVVAPPIVLLLVVLLPRPGVFALPAVVLPTPGGLMVPAAGPLAVAGVAFVVRELVEVPVALLMPG